MCLGKGLEVPSGKTARGASATAAAALGTTAGMTTGMVTRGSQVSTATREALGKAIVARVVGTLRVHAALAPSKKSATTLSRPTITALVSMGADSSYQFTARRTSAALAAATCGRSPRGLLPQGPSSTSSSAAGPACGFGQQYCIQHYG